MIAFPPKPLFYNMTLDMSLKQLFRSLQVLNIFLQSVHGAVFNVSVQVFYFRHRTERLPEAGPGTGDSFQRNSRVPG